MPLFKKPKQLFLIIYSVLIVGGAIATSYMNMGPKLDKVVFKQKDGVPNGYTSCKVAVNIDENYLLDMTFLLPYKDSRQEAELDRLMPRIKNSIIEKMNTKTATMIRNGELGKFKKELVTIINKETNSSFDNIYFEKVNLY